MHVTADYRELLNLSETLKAVTTQQLYHQQRFHRVMMHCEYADAPVKVSRSPARSVEGNVFLVCGIALPHGPILYRCHVDVCINHHHHIRYVRFFFAAFGYCFSPNTHIFYKVRLVFDLGVWFYVLLPR